jgi:hypothetical protein
MAPANTSAGVALARLARHYLDRPGTTFLLAERQPDGTRSFRVLPGQPQATSHGICSTP